MANQDTSTKPQGGVNRSKGISWTDLMKTDARPVPEFLTKESYTYRGSDPIAAERYTSAEFAKLEEKKMWPNVWQFAAREEDMPEPGDYIVYENAGRSYIVSRQKDGAVRACRLLTWATVGFIAMDHPPSAASSRGRNRLAGSDPAGVTSEEIDELFTVQIGYLIEGIARDETMR